ncbi:MAG: hypothetical protein IJ766_03835 [Clostridia bacterium]|nr:hypothetical protein [Clostridia bacterium]
MNRLTEWCGDHAAVVNHHENYIDRLAAYEDTGLEPAEVAELAKAKADGRLVALPCKVGDIVYWNAGLSIRVYRVQGFMIGQDSKFRLDLGGFQPVYPWEDHIFLTREAAEAAIKGANCE